MGRPAADLAREQVELVRFLRALKDRAGLTVAQLEGPTGFGKTAVSRRLAGTGLDWRFVEQVVRACTEGHELRPRRERDLARARELWQACERPPQRPVVRAAQAAPLDGQRRTIELQGELLDTQRRLIRTQAELVDAVEAQAQSTKALMQANQLTLVLSVMLGSLRERVDQLTGARELPPPASGPQALDGGQLRLDRAERQLTRTQEELRRAEAERSEALQLIAEATRRVGALRREIDGLRAALGPAIEEGSAPLPPTAPVPAQRVEDDPATRDYDAALDRAAQVAAEITTQLQAARARLGASVELPFEAEHRIVPGAVLSAADNPATSADSAGNAEASGNVEELADEWPRAGENGGLGDGLVVIPGSAVLRAMAQAAHPPWQCLAELIDLLRATTGERKTEEDPLTIEIVVPVPRDDPAEAKISLTDNGCGMDPATLSQRLLLGLQRDGSPFGTLFNLGFYQAVFGLGSRVEIMTSTAGEEWWNTAVLTVEALLHTGSVTQQVHRTPKWDAGDHGTKLTISGLHADPKPTSSTRRLGEVGRMLGDVYSHPLVNKQLRLYLNKKLLYPRRPCVWSGQRTVQRAGREISAVQNIDRVLPPVAQCQECGMTNVPGMDACPVCGSARLVVVERRIWGWLGVQRYLDEVDYGIDFLSHGRKILLRDKRVFDWSDPDGLAPALREYPVDNPAQLGRLVGEIHCDHVAVFAAKNGFDFGSEDWQEVVRTIRGDGPIRPKLALAKGYQENDSPLALLFRGFRRNDPGLHCLVPGDGRLSLTRVAKEWASRFHAGDPEYLTDERWYLAAVRHDERQAARAEGLALLPGNLPQLGRPGHGLDLPRLVASVAVVGYGRPPESPARFRTALYQAVAAALWDAGIPLNQVSLSDQDPDLLLVFEPVVSFSAVLDSWVGSLTSAVRSALADSQARLLVGVARGVTDFTDSEFLGPAVRHADQLRDHREGRQQLGESGGDTLLTVDTELYEQLTGESTRQFLPLGAPYVGEPVIAWYRVLSGD